LNWTSVIFEVSLPPQQLGIDLGEFLQLLLQLEVMVDAASSGLLLGRSLEEELVDLTNRQALSQVVERAVLLAIVVAMAVGLAATGETLYEGSAQGVGAHLDLREQESLALAQGEGGFAGAVYLSHTYGKDTKNAARVNKKENGVKMRNCFQV
jgi:hypothetical protein